MSDKPVRIVLYPDAHRVWRIPHAGVIDFCLCCGVPMTDVGGRKYLRNGVVVYEPTLECRNQKCECREDAER